MTTCHDCRCVLDVCEVCERPDCPEAMCYRCVREALLPAAPDITAPDASDV